MKMHPRKCCSTSKNNETRREISQIDPNTFWLTNVSFYVFWLAAAGRWACLVAISNADVMGKCLYSLFGRMDLQEDNRCMRLPPGALVA